MKRLRDIISEAAQFQKLSGEGFISHRANINGRFLYIQHTEKPLFGVETAFTYDGDFVKDKEKNISAAEATKVYHTVRDSISHYIKEKKPSYLKFSPADSKYIRHYERIANHIATIHNGTVEKDEKESKHPIFKIKFNG